MRDAGRCACGALPRCGSLSRCGSPACVSVPTASVPDEVESEEAHAPYCTNDCQYRYTTRKITKTKTVYNTQRAILRMQANPACVSKSA
jgi:hypothetical protein